MKQRTEKRLPVSGGSWITVDVYGDENVPSLVIVPGAMADAQAWSSVADAITAWPSVAVVNRRGRDRSGPLTKNYSVGTEIEDLKTVLSSFGGAISLFGWSYGGLIVLMAANDTPVRQVIAYEPVMKPFGEHALQPLREATEKEDWDSCVEIATRDVAGLSQETVDALRLEPKIWKELSRFSVPGYAELRAMNDVSHTHEFARLAESVDLIVGQKDRDIPPYGIAFENIRAKVNKATVYELPDQGHLAHLEAPKLLGALLNSLAR